ncbi:sideroflexin-4 isoform X3 [Phycodurus eques]|uniref:sideroflexin-4 isoform X3 n=1 Tax=Phycodurus eques TaxID=693459 RepID=UPI002ACEFD61|nr:sideroflexin-4 isoform X3 [Phycodurus eques]
MDANLLYWKSHGESVFSRLKVWVNLLDPSFLLTSNAEIQETRTQLRSEEKVKKKDEHAWNISLSSIHPDSGSVLPLVFRPPVFTTELHCRVQLCKQKFFFRAGSDSISEAASLDSRDSLICHMCRGPSSNYCEPTGYKKPTHSKFLQVYRTSPTLRGEECETGIQVFDSNGNTVGISKAAAEKAVMETALSRAVLFGTTGAVPSLLVSVLKRTRLFQKNSLLIPPIRHISVAFVLGLMIPLSFSLFSQMGTIRKENVEEELQAKMAEGQLFYHRGL